MIGTVVSAIFVGLVVGALARLILPGKQSIGVIMTILLGAIGSFSRVVGDLQVGVSRREWRIQADGFSGRHHRGHAADLDLCRSHGPSRSHTH